MATDFFLGSCIGADNWRETALTHLRNVRNSTAYSVARGAGSFFRLRIAPSSASRAPLRAAKVGTASVLEGYVGLSI